MIKDIIQTFTNEINKDDNKEILNDLIDSLFKEWSTLLKYTLFIIIFLQILGIIIGISIHFRIG